ncbi:MULTISPECIES: glycoside hydrolase family 16 protein [unclassified Deinococcus]|uniref:glycoside hydrolase family 16 protein n=1 Tax=unclassified Deinococcus TaxID=2623546 RepID=UPI001C2FC160|nr:MULTISPECIES: glycoside hydrolase family 16 protein [unclassified Deinococcus]MDK2012446.1 glycoside hydrolase family 16 protein [Deinococcus sp. 43]
MTTSPRSILLLLLGAALSACGQTTSPTSPGLTAQAVSGDFSRWGMSWSPSTWKNGDPLFGCTFSKNNLTLGGGSDAAVYGWLDSSTCSEIKSNRWKTQGTRFGGDIYVPNVAGTTTLFTYFNDGTVWNEIDVEFVPSRGSLHPALIYRNGGSRYVYEAWLPAASNAWHRVDVNWTASSIVWTLNGRVVFTMYRNASLPLGATVVTGSGSSMQVPAAAWPTRSPQLIANFWRGSNTADARGFLGSYGGGTGQAIWNNLY